MKMLVVLTTAPNIKEAESLAQKIIEAKLAACVQISPQITSFYTWKGKIQKDTEHQIFIKTLPEKFDELRIFIQANHSYDVPEIVGIPVERGSQDYLTWIKDSV